MNAVECRRVHQRFGRAWALRDTNLTLPTGAVMGLVGHNGAGKSTLLHLVAGLDHPSQGTVRVLGRAPGREDVLSDVAFVAQSAPLPKRLRVAEVTGLAARLNRRWDAGLVDARCRDLGISTTQRIGALSEGQRAQVALALALAKQPRLLVLDEPVASLDPLARRGFLGALMAAVAERDLTVVFSTHLLDDLARTCDHVAVIRAGTVVLEGAIDTLLDSHAVLTGPADRPTPAGARAVGPERSQHQRLVRREGSIADPAWEARPIGLEEMVLAYLEEPVESSPRMWAL